MLCPNCQAERPDDAQFCPHCGTPVPEGSSAQVHQQVGTVTDGGAAVGTIQTGEGSQVHVGGKVTYEAPPIGVAALHQLPQPPRDFTGRETELAELEAALTTGGATLANGCPLVGLRGMGGVGKTALALVLAHRLAPRYPDAQFFLDLRGTSPRPLTAAQAMAHVIHAYHPTAQLPETDSPAGKGELAAQYSSVLHGQRALLLMDNAADQAQVEPLLPPDSCLLLVTSRQRFMLPGLHALNLDTLRKEDAVALLLRIAPRIDGQAEEMALLCDGLPLALRLAASALAERENLRVERYLARLKDAQTRLGLVDASLRLSYDLLKPALQTRWRALAAFPATFGLSAAAAVWDVEGDAAEETLGELLRYSMLEWDGEAGRYRLHDLARACAEAWLREGEGERARQRHATHFEQVLRAAESLYEQGGEEVSQGLHLLDLVWEDIEVGQRWAVEYAGRNPVAAELCPKYANAGWRLLSLRLPSQEQIRWLEPALAVTRQWGDRRSEARYLGGLGYAYRGGEPVQAVVHYQQALDIGREIRERGFEAHTLSNLGAAYCELGEVDCGISHIERALEIARQIGDRRCEAMALYHLGGAYEALNQAEQSIDYYEQALAIDQETGDLEGKMYTLGGLGFAYRQPGRRASSIVYYHQAVEIAREIGDRRYEAHLLSNLGAAYCELGQAERGISYIEPALDLARSIDDPPCEAMALGHLGSAYRDLGRVEQAIGLYEQALALARENDDRRNEAWVGWNLGRLYEDTDPARAVELMSVCVAYEREIGHPDAEPDAQRVDQIRRRMAGQT